MRLSQAAVAPSPARGLLHPPPPLLSSWLRKRSLLGPGSHWGPAFPEPWSVKAPRALRWPLLAKVALGCLSFQGGGGQGSPGPQQPCQARGGVEGTGWGRQTRTAESGPRLRLSWVPTRGRRTPPLCRRLTGDWGVPAGTWQGAAGEGPLSPTGPAGRRRAVVPRTGAGRGAWALGGWPHLDCRPGG